MRVWILALLLGMASTVARADTIDDFVVTGDGHTITFSLPAIYQVANPQGHPFTPTVLGSTTATVDGVGGNPLSTSFYMFPNASGGDLVFNPAVDGIAGLYLRGPQVVQYTADSTIYNYVIGFTPGTFNLVEAYGYPSIRSVQYAIYVDDYAGGFCGAGAGWMDAGRDGDDAGFRWLFR